jgi:citrate synthase
MAPEHYLSAQEAARTLGISRATLYAYVSRGLIRSEAAGKRRTRQYNPEDVQALKERKEQRKDPQKVAERALHWGAPVMDSALSLIADGCLYYCGHEAISLAATCSAEQVAWLLWTGQRADSVDASVTLPVYASLRAGRRMVAHLQPVDAFQVLLPLAVCDDLAAYDLRPAAVMQTGWRILRLLAAIATGQAPSTQPPLAETLQQGWVADDPQVTGCLNTALVLCADHELNVSSFTARCVASAGATPYAVVAAALAALQGTKHGGHTARVEALLQEVGTPQAARAVLTSRLRRGESIAGFGHPFYPTGDPRCAALLRLASTVRPTSPAVALATAVSRAAYEVLGEYPTLDFGLAVLGQALQLPPGGAMALFAIGRAIGWIGHAIEQYQQDRIIRPRARYVGVLPAASPVSAALPVC